MFRDITRNNRLLMLALFIWALGEGLWYYNLRQLYLVELGATEIQVGNVLALEAAFRALMPIPAGYLADRIGARRVMIFSWVLGVLGAALGGLAQTWQGAIPGLMVYAVSGIAVPSISVFVLKNASTSASGSTDRALALVYAVYPAGLIISPTMGGLIADALNIRALLWISSAFFVISTAVIWLTTEMPAGTAAHHDERPRDLLRNKPFRRVSGYFLLAITGLYLGYQLLPNYMHDVRGLTYSGIGLLFSVAAVGTVIANLLVSRNAPRWNGPMIVGIYTIAMLILWQFDFPIAFVVGFLGVGSLSAMRSVATARFADVVSPRNRGLAFGVLETILSLAVGVAGGLAGRLYALTPAHDLAFIGVLALAPLLVALWFALWSSLPQQTQTPFPSSLTPGDR